jgi:rhamnogalacturonyl hydrolase YesR
MHIDKFMRLFLLPCICFAICAASGCAQTRRPPTTQPATLAFSSNEIRTAMRKACDYQLELQSHTKPENGWIRSAFYTGVMAAYSATKDPHYLQAAEKWSNHFHFTPPPKRDANNDCCGQTYVELYFQNHDEARIAPLRQRFDAMVADPRAGGSEWWWCDALFMSPPALARLSAATGDKRYNDYMDKMWWDVTRLLFDKDETLFYRDKSFFPDKRKTANGKKIFWSRGNGWVMGGTVRVLQYLPKDFPSRQKYIDLHRSMAARIARLQGADGLWRSSLLDPEEFPTPETSGSGFFCYAIAWGINNGTLDRAIYEPVARKSWAGLTSMLTPEGRLTHVQKVAGGPGEVKPDDTHEYAVGAFLLAGSEMLKLVERRH